MFETLSERLQSAFRHVRGAGRFTEQNMTEALRDVRRALLEADVALPVVKRLIDQVRDAALGQEVQKSLDPGQGVVKRFHQALMEVMGAANDSLNLRTRPPAVVLMAGLQGAGKTTSAAKLARYLREREKKRVLLVSTDVYRPAAIDQLARLAEQTGSDFFRGPDGALPVAIAAEALVQARLRGAEVLIVDTAGRLHIDADMMAEIKAIHAAIDPIETLFVVDAMTGQDAANVSAAFHSTVPLTGVVLAKADGDARGGAALSIREVTGAPIKFLGIGEKTDALEAFHPDRVASRILGMGDVLSLIEEAERKIDHGQMRKVSAKIVRGKGFDLADFRDQIRQMEKLGGMASVLDKLPGMGAIGAQQAGLADRQTRRIVAIIDSMTPEERRSPAMIRGSRKTRIARGSGTEVQDVNRLLKQFADMQKMMKRFGKGGLGRLLQMTRGFPGSPR